MSTYKACKDAKCFRVGCATCIAAHFSKKPNDDKRGGESPLDMLLFCPRCSLQHVDEPEPEKGWTNPPHATHTCRGCGLNWRPSNGLTNGVGSLPAAEVKHLERMKASDPLLYAGRSATQQANGVLWTKVTSLRALRKNWDSYGAEPFPEATIQLAIRVACWLGDKWKVVPCADGPSVWFFRGDEEEIIEVRTSEGGANRG